MASYVDLNQRRFLCVFAYKVAPYFILIVIRFAKFMFIYFCFVDLFASLGRKKNGCPLLTVECPESC